MYLGLPVMILLLPSNMLWPCSVMSYVTTHTYPVCEVGYGVGAP